MSLSLYRILFHLTAPFLKRYLQGRVEKGKEDPKRLSERYGESSRPRPEGELIWFHAASVGESVSILTLIELLLNSNDNLHILVTTGTVTSAELLGTRLPDRAFHQYLPLDHPKWVKRFLDHWRPQVVIFTESEFWPSLINEIKKRHIPCGLLNARLSKKSLKQWSRMPGVAKNIVGTFDVILAQSQEDVEAFRQLGSAQVVLAGNIKYCSSALPFKPDELKRIKKVVGKRPVWLYASTHDGEEQIACRIHMDLVKKHPNLLSIIVPRHPQRREQIIQNCLEYDVQMQFRGEERELPTKNCDVYVADTLGELGLFYRLVDIAVIGRSLSLDGGGGHNPIEAGQLDCAVISGAHIQYQQQLFANFIEHQAVEIVADEQELCAAIDHHLSDREFLKQRIEASKQVSVAQGSLMIKVLRELEPLLLEGKIHLPPDMFRYDQEAA